MGIFTSIRPNDPELVVPGTQPVVLPASGQPTLDAVHCCCEDLELPPVQQCSTPAVPAPGPTETSTPCSYSTLINRCMQGDKTAFRELCDRTREACGNSFFGRWISDFFLSAISSIAFGTSNIDEVHRTETKPDVPITTYSEPIVHPVSFVTLLAEPPHQVRKAGGLNGDSHEPESLIDAYEGAHQRAQKEVEAQRLVQTASRITPGRLDRSDIGRLLEAYNGRQVDSQQLAEIERIFAELEREEKV